MNTFPKRLKAVRKHFGLSAEQLGAALDVSHQTIYRWEKGKSKPFSIIRKVVEARLDELENQPNKDKAVA